MAIGSTTTSLANLPGVHGQQYRHLNQSQGGGKLRPTTILCNRIWGDRGYMKEFNNWILAQFPSGGVEPVMLALASVAAQVPALGVAQGWCPC